jgi:hypothetical protein
VMVPEGEIDSKVHDVDVSGSDWYAATAKGVYISKDQGATWVGGPVLGKEDYHDIAALGSMLVVSQRSALAGSQDGGQTWQPIAMPDKLTWIQSIAVAGDSSLWVGGREGVFYSTDRGQTWAQESNLPISNISGLSYDASSKRVLATSWNSSWLLAIDPSDRTFKFYDPGWRVRHVRSIDGRLVAASPYNGVVMQPNGAEASKVAVATSGKP